MFLTKFLSFKTGPASPRTTAIGMAFAASIMLVLAIVVGRMSYELDVIGQRTQGEVIQIITTSDDMQRAVFQFSDMHGQIHTVEDRSQSSYTRYEIGQKLTLVYDQENPSGARKGTRVSLYLGPVLLGLMSLLFYGGAALVWRFRSHFQKDYEARRGRTIVTIVNSDGSVTQTTHSSVPVFRGTGIVLAGLGIAAWLGALGVTFRGLVVVGQPLTISISVFLFVVGSLLLMGATASLRHAKFLQKLE